MKINDVLSEEKVRLDPKCWKGKKIGNPKTKMKGGVRVNNCVPAESLNEFAPDGDEDPYDYYPCYDCGSTIFLHHTELCELAEPNAVRDLPSKNPRSQHWNGIIPKGLHPIVGLQEAQGLDPDIFEELDPRFIARVAKKIVPTIRAKETEEGYAHLTTADGLNLVIGCSIADGDISINIGSDPMSTTSSGQNKGAVTNIIKAVYDAAVKKYGQPESGSLSVDYDAGQGVWQHIANKLGLEYGAYSVKEQDVSEGIVDTIRAANYDRLANRSAKQAAQWALASRGGKRSPTQIALGAKSAERAKKAAELRGQASGDESNSLEEVDRRGFLKGLGAAALGAAALGAGAQTMPNMDAPKQIELAQRYYKALVQRAKEDGEELDTRTLNRLKAKATDAAARKFQENPRQQVPQQQNYFPSQGSERKVARDIGDFRESQNVAENYDNGEYSDEAGMAHGNLITIAKAARGLLDTIDQHEDLPEWVQEKIAKVEGMLVSAWNYLQSQEAQGIDPRITEVYGTLAEAWSDVRQRMELVEEFDIIERVVEGLAHHNGVDQEVIWEDLESLTDDELYVFAVTTPIMEDWQKVNKRDKTDGMSRKAVNAYRREHPGSKLKTAVTTKPSKLKKGSKASKRRKSYCSRSRGQMKMHHISCAKTPDKAICKARRRWNC